MSSFRLFGGARLRSGALSIANPATAAFFAALSALTAFCFGAFLALTAFFAALPVLAAFCFAALSALTAFCFGALLALIAFCAALSALTVFCFAALPALTPFCAALLALIAFCFAALAGPGLAAAVLCQDAADPAGLTSPPEAAKVVIATVDGQPIYAAEAERMLKQVLGSQLAEPAVLPVLKAQVLAEIVDRRLVLAYARESGDLATAAEVSAALDDLGKRLQAQGSDLKQYLAAQGIDEQDLRRQITWRITWNRLLRKYVSQQRMEQYFAQHRRELDGTELAVSHILITAKDDPTAGGTGGEKATALLKRAAELRAEILAGKLSFQEAARRYSSSPTGAEGGRLGYIRRDGPMVESFTRAAFALQPGEISQPVVTPFGVHLIRCDAVRPGKKQLGDVLQQVEDGLARQLLEELAAQQRQRCSVQYTGAWPHFKPGSKELAPR